MATDTTYSYRLAVDDEDYHEEEDYYDFPESWEEGPWYDPQDGDYL